MNEFSFNKDITKDKRIFTCETIQQYYLVSFVLEEANIKDQHEYNKTIKLINRYEIETTDKDNNKVRYIYNEDDNKIQVKSIL